MPGSDSALKGVLSNKQEPLCGSFFLHGYEELAPVLVWGSEMEPGRGGNQKQTKEK